MISKKITKTMTLFMMLFAVSTGYASTPVQEESTRPLFEERAQTVAKRMAIAEQRALEQLEAQENGEEPVEKGYYPSHPGVYHVATAITPTGDMIEIEDGSVWSVNSRHHSKVRGWNNSDSLIIGQNNSWFSSYLYVMINQSHNNQKVEVNGSLAPYLDSPYRHWISDLNIEYPAVRLEDGTWWKLNSSDRAVMKDWLHNDTIIIGVNQDWFTWGYHYILINVNTNEFVRTSQM